MHFGVILDPLLIRRTPIWNLSGYKSLTHLDAICCWIRNDEDLPIWSFELLFLRFTRRLRLFSCARYVTLTCLFCFCYISSACYIAEAPFDTCLVWFRARLISPFREGRGQLGGFSILNWCNSRETIRKSSALLQSRKGDNSLLLDPLRYNCWKNLGFDGVRTPVS